MSIIPFGFLRKATSGGNPELYTEANALSRTNEANTKTNIGSVTSTVTSVSSPTPQDGSYLIRIDGVTGGRAEVNFTGIGGVTYIVKYWGWEESSSSGYAHNWTNQTGAVTPQSWTSTPTEYTQTITCTITGNMILRFYFNSGTGVYIDGLSIKEQ